jgi:hypothetical protein
VTVIVAGIIHLLPVRVETQMIAFEPLDCVTAIFLDLALIHSSDRKPMAYTLLDVT